MFPETLILPLPLPALPAQPLVSVLIASYNYERYLGRALDSLLVQSYSHFEALVCDDGSTDDSREVAAGYARRDGRIRLLTQDNGGVASALNRAYAASRGEVIVLLDADDYFMPDKLARVVACLQQHPRAGLALHAMQVVDPQGRVLHGWPSGGACEEGWLAERVQARGGRWRAMPSSALAFHRAVAARLFPIPEAMFRSEADGFLTTLAPLLTEVAFLPDVLAGYRLHGANLTGALHLDRSVIGRGLDALRRKQEAVNRRLVELGVENAGFALEDNLNVREHRFMQALFEGVPRRMLLRAYGRLARVLLQDDLYGLVRKALGLVAYAGAIMLPVAWRRAWLDGLLGARGLRRILHCVRSAA